MKLLISLLVDVEYLRLHNDSLRMDPSTEILIYRLDFILTEYIMSYHILNYWNKRVDDQKSEYIGIIRLKY